MTLTTAPHKLLALKPTQSPDLLLPPENPGLPELIEDDWCYIPEDPIQAEFKYVSAAAEQLHAKPDPFEAFYKSLSPIVNYERANYTILYATKEGLDYYMPRMPCGRYSSGDEVIKFIENKIDEFSVVYNKQPVEQRWKVLRISRQLLPGLERIIEDYSNSSTYAPFKEGVVNLKKKLESFILEKSKAMNREISIFISRLDNYSLFDLLGLYADSYPRHIVYECIVKCYGMRLAGQIFPKFVENSEDTKASIPYDEVYGLLFAIATHVRWEDLEWKYEQLKNPSVERPSVLVRGLGVVEKKRNNDHARSIDYLDPAVARGATKMQFHKSFADLSSPEINQLLAYFRRAPNGLNLLDYFGIPISLGKNNVIATFLNSSVTTAPQQNRINEINFYADMESTKIWHCRGIIQMSRVQMFDQLSRLFENSNEAQLFHTDRYISFMNVAATAIAYLKSCNSADEVSAKMEPLLELLNGIVANAHLMYPKEFVEAYKTCWLTLIGKLKDGMRDPSFDFTPYYLSFYTHPLLLSEQRMEVLKCHFELQQREFLARKAAYWHRYELTSSFHVDDAGRLHIPDLNHRKGTIFHLNTGKKMELFYIARVILRDGFVCQLCIPCRPEEYARTNVPLPIKIIFQGTINNPLSIERDKNISGPGYDLWCKETTSLVIPELRVLMEDLKVKYPAMTFNWDCTGHSLGGADAQNFLSYVAQAVLSRDLTQEWITRINLYTFNTAGVPVDTAKRFNNNFNECWSCIGDLAHSLVKNDLVSRGGEAMIGYELPCPEKLKVLQVYNCGVYHLIVNHCDFNHSWTDTILPQKLLGPKEASIYLKRSAHSWTALGEHARGLLSENPILQVLTGIVCIAGAIFLNYQFALLAEGMMFMGGGIVTTGVRIANLEGDMATRGEIREQVSKIWKAATNQWEDNQVLERKE